MPAPLSLDLRERIVRAVENGSSIRQAALRFEVSPSAAVKLLRRVRASGNAAPARFGGHRRPILDEHETLVRSLLNAKPDTTWTCLKAMESTFMTQEVLHAPIPPTLYAGIPG